ncbi:hypothetical protein RJ640_021090 [Escallonia rubra]|uniref:Uncharacterized protein n=1 Tax=Escallonia rubra TaxID=112253 RepID=A0AA88UEH8_9ASTE|nr:hypothetical protein RJ640_021090 [Escallonia rubra]
MSGWGEKVMSGDKEDAAGDLRATTELDQRGEEAEEEEGHEEEEEGDEDDEEDVDRAYTLRFGGEMDPLAFTEDDAFGVQPYQQFERLEHQYEALAAKKRKALSHNHHHHPREMPAKKSRQVDIPEASIEEMMEVMTYGMRRKPRKSKKRGRRKGSKSKLSPEITRKLGDATLHYAHGRYDEAICLLKEVIRVSPNLPDSYHTLGLIYNAIGG